MFLPVQITAGRLAPFVASSQTQAMLAKTEAAREEIALPDGTCSRVSAGSGLATLRRVTTAVRR